MRRWHGRAILGTLRLAVLMFVVAVVVVVEPEHHTTDRGTRSSGDGVPSVLLWTMMRSGSRMVQHLLTAQSCSFPTEEPLRRYTTSKDLNVSVSVLQDLLACRFSTRSDNLTKWVNESYTGVPHVFRLCQAFPRLCLDGMLVDALCKASCLRLVRVVAAGLAVAMGLLQDRGANTHIVHLVRDPRGMISSRQDLQEGKLRRFVHPVNGIFFRNDEMDLSVLCLRYRHDLAVARHLARHYPDRYTLVRYEDIARHPPTEVRRLYAFMGVPYTSLVASVVSRHTMGFFGKAGEEHPFSTSKNSSGIVFSWRSRLAYSAVERIQEECGDVLRAYGYRQLSRHQYDQEDDLPLLPLPEDWTTPLSGDEGDG